MSFLDNLKTIASGIGDIGRAPLGFIWDGVRAMVSTDYNPGFEGLLSQQLDLGVGGLSKIGTATGLSALGETIGRNTPVDEVITGLIHEGELLYNTEYQKQTNDVPLYAEPFKVPFGTPGAVGVEPGEQSIQRAAAVGTGAVGAALPAPGGTPLSAAVNVSQLYRRSSESTPGRAFVDNIIDLYSMPRKEQERIRAQGWYIMTTGSIDAVSRWYLQPEVIAGKGLKKLRSYRNPTIPALIARAERKTGMTFKEFRQGLDINGRPTGPVQLQVQDANGRTLIHVTRQSALKNIVGNPHLKADVDADGVHFRPAGEGEGIKRVPVGSDTVHYGAETYHEHQRLLDERFGDNLDINDRGLDDEFADWAEEIGVRGGTTTRGMAFSSYARLNKRLKEFMDQGNGEYIPDRFDTPEAQRLYEFFIQHKATEGLARRVLAQQGVADELVREDVARRLADYSILDDNAIIDDLVARYPDVDLRQVTTQVDQIQGRIQSYMDNPTNQPIEPLLEYIDALDAGAIPPNARNRIAVGLHDNVQTKVESQITKDNFAGRGALGSVIQNQQVIPQFPAPRYRAIYLLDEADMEEAKRYAAALYHADPTDPPVVIHIDADGLPVVFEDYRHSAMPSFTEIDPRGRNLPADASLMTLVDHIGKDQILKISEFTAEDLDATARLGKTIPGYLEPGGRMEANLFSPDGSVVEPWEVRNLDDVTDDLLTGTYLWNQDPILAQKFFDARARERNWNAIPKSNNPVEMAMNHKNVQRMLNQIDGKSADTIRRVWFPKHPFGAIIATYLADAQTYAQRRAVLAASMGFRLPEFETLPQILKAKLAIGMRELELANKGNPNGPVLHDERMLAMLDEPSRFNNLTPEEMKVALQETVASLESQRSYSEFLDEMSRHPVLREVPKRGDAALMFNRIRASHFYQQSPMARPIRVVTEMRPHRWVNVNDPNADIQLVRQMEEAAPLGVSGQMVAQYREKFMRARNAADRILILAEAEDEIIRAASKRANLTTEEFEEVLESARTGRARVGEFLGSHRYAPNEKDMVSWYDQDTGESIVLAMPIISTQLREFVPMADVREIIRYSTKIGRFKERNGGASIRHLLDSFNQLWKPTVLLRGGWMLRVVSDEQLRILAKTGSIVKHLAAIEAGENIGFSGIFKKGLSGGQRVAEAASTVALTQPLTAGVQRAAGVGAKVARLLGRLDEDYLRYLKQAGLEPLASSRAAFAGPDARMMDEMSALFGQSEKVILNHLIDKGTGQWQSVAKGSQLYDQSWLRVLTHQLHPDPLAHRMAESFLEMMEDNLAKGLGRPMDEDILATAHKVMDDFLKTAEGKEYLSAMPWREQNTAKWAEDLAETIVYYTADLDHSLLQGVVVGGLKGADLRKIDEAIRPATVHGEIVAQVLGQGDLIKFMRDLTAGGFDLMGRLPTDTLSRQPFYKQMWANEMVRLERHANKMGVDIDEQWIKRASEQARQHALLEVKELLYDLAETSRFGHMMRFFTPFFSAWQETLKVWTGLSLKDPSIPARGYLLWTAPDRAGITVKDEETGEEYMMFRLSEKTTNSLGLTGWSKYLAEGGVQFGKQSFNLALSNPLPGVGPLIQYPLNEAAKHKPELEEGLKFLLPYGVRANSWDLIASPLVRSFATELTGMEGERAYQRNYANAVTWLDYLYRSGQRSVPPTEEEAHDVARKIRIVQWVARLQWPSQPIFNSPLEPYIDIYRDMIETFGPSDADEMFLNEYGQEFMAITVSRTVSKTGLPPTVEAQVARRQFDDLITKYPEFGSLIVGDAAVGEFSSAAFASQLETPIDPNDPYSEMERDYRFLDLDPNTGRIEEVDRRLGWQEYVKMLDLIDLERRSRGLPNLRVKDAQDLALLKAAFTQKLAAQYPSWWDDFNQRDELKWDKRIEGFREIANSPLMEDRPDMQGIKDYITARELILQELNRRKMLGGASTLEATSNQDIRLLWETIITRLVEENIAFGPVYYRYLEGDPVTLRTGPATTPAPAPTGQVPQGSTAMPSPELGAPIG